MTFGVIACFNEDLYYKVNGELFNFDDIHVKNSESFSVVVSKNGKDLGKSHTLIKKLMNELMARDESKFTNNLRMTIKRLLSEDKSAYTVEKIRTTAAMFAFELEEDVKIPQQPRPITVDLEQAVILDLLDDLEIENASLAKKWLLPPYTIEGAEESIARLSAAIDQINRQFETKIHVEKTRDGFQLHHTKYEMNAFIALHPELHGYFTSKKGELCFGSTLDVNSSEKMLCYLSNFDKREILKELKFQYTSLSPQPVLPVVQPEFKDFSATNEEVTEIFASLLSQSEGLVIGEKHEDFTPKQILSRQMKNLYAQGVRTLFLEHCCFDTLQVELDRFYIAKTPTAFLEEFLRNGCGSAVGSVNYYDLVRAAVLAGIRPIGIEISSTQLLGYREMGGSDGIERSIGMNVLAKQIIDQEKGKGKYIALVGSGHASYCNGIAGLSELCGIPNMMISDKEKETDLPTYEKNLEYLGRDMNIAANVKMFNNNPGQVYFTHAHLTCAGEEK
jgi:hypothetical protein